jgi:hypothetical protein
MAFERDGREGGETTLLSLHSHTHFLSLSLTHTHTHLVSVVEVLDVALEVAVHGRRLRYVDGLHAHVVQAEDLGALEANHETLLGEGSEEGKEDRV